MGLFKKKPGGTLVGNLLRGLSSKVAPGVLGTGKDKIPLPPGQAPTQSNIEFDRAAAVFTKGPKVRAAVPAATFLGFGALVVLAAFLFRPKRGKRK